MEEETKKYNVAISCLAVDEPLGRSIHDHLVLSVAPVFFYTAAQREISGRDGVETFRQVFRSESRVVVVLFRNGWGETNWTAVEEVAIKDFGLSNRWKSLLFVRLDSSTDLPRWVPDSHIWFDYPRLGLSGLVAVVERMVGEAGGEVKPERASERAVRLSRQAHVSEQRERRRNSFEGVQAAHQSLLELQGALRDLSDEVNTETKEGDKIQFTRSGELIIILSGHASVTASWNQPAGNMLEGSALLVKEWDGHPGGDFGERKRRAASERQYELRLDEEDKWRWSAGEGERWYSAVTLAEEIIKLVADRAYRNRTENRR